ncbi:MAG: helix-turn-helix domain-containing protein [Bacteroidales bacterium]|nr:helix-turn-helix domain-containing protein [Bacteroidales bacterium]
MIDRINLILKAKNITARQFAEEIGIQPSGMSHIMSGRNRPSLDFVKKVINRYPEIDIKWLTFGEGEMYAPSIVAVPASSGNAVSTATSPQAAAPAGAPAAAPAPASKPSQPTSGATRPVQAAAVQPDLFSNMEGTLFADVPPTADDPQAIETDGPAKMIEAYFPGVASNVPVAAQGVGGESVASGPVPNAGVMPTVPPATPVAETVQAVGGQMAAPTPSVNSAPSGNTAPSAQSSSAVAAPSVVGSTTVGSTPAVESSAQTPSPMHTDNGRQSYVDENRLNGMASAVVPENQNLRRKKIVKVVVLYNDHSFSEYYPE